MISLGPARCQLRKSLTFTDAGRARLNLRLPQTWRCWETDSTSWNLGSEELRFGPNKERPRLLLSLMLGDPDGPDLETGQLRQYIKDSIQQFAGQVAEPVVDLYEIAAVNASGYFYRLRDSNPKPDEFVYMTQGTLIVGSSRILFTSFTNEDEEAIDLAALSIVQSCSLTSHEKAAKTQTDSLDGASLLDRFRTLRYASEACLFLQDFPEVLEATPPTQVDNGHLAATFVLQRAIHFGAAIAIGSEPFAQPCQQLIAILTTLNGHSTFNDLVVRQDMYVALGKLTELSGTDLRLRNYLRLALVGDFIREAAMLLPNLMESACTTLYESIEAFAGVADRYLQMQAFSWLSYLLPTLKVGDPGKYLETSISLGEEALKALVRSGLTEDWATLQIRIGIKYATRIFGDRRKNLAESILRYKAGLQFSHPGSPNERGANTNIGLAYLEMADEHDIETLRHAKDHLEKALSISELGSDEMATARARLNLGNACLRLTMGDLELGERAIALYQATENTITRTRDPDNWAGIQHNIGTAFAGRQVGVESENLGRAAAHLALALEVRTRARSPSQYVDSSYELAMIRMKQSDFLSANDSFLNAVSAVRLQTSKSDFRTERRAEYAKSQQLFPDAAFCLLKLGRVQDAVAMMEQGRARELRQVMEPEASPGDAAKDHDDGTDGMLQNALDLVLNDMAPLSADNEKASLARRAAAQHKGWLSKFLLGKKEVTPIADIPETFETTRRLLDSIPEGHLVVFPILSRMGSGTVLLRARSQALTTDDLIRHEPQPGSLFELVAL